MADNRPGDPQPAERRSRLGDALPLEDLELFSEAGESILAPAVMHQSRDTLPEEIKESLEREEQEHQRQIDAVTAEGHESLAAHLTSLETHDGYLNDPSLRFVYFAEERIEDRSDIGFASESLAHVLEWAIGHTSEEFLERGAHWAICAQVLDCLDDELPGTMLCFVSAEGRPCFLRPDVLEELGY